MLCNVFRTWFLSNKLAQINAGDYVVGSVVDMTGVSDVVVDITYTPCFISVFTLLMYFCLLAPEAC